MRLPITTRTTSSRIAFVLVVAVAVAAPVCSQTEWTSYLQGPARDEVADAATVIDRWYSARDERRTSAYAAIQERYVAARRDALSYADYVALLAEDAILNPAVPESVVAARAVLGSALQSDVPVPGTRTFERAETWLTRLARYEGVPASRFVDVVASLSEEIVGSLSPGELTVLIQLVPLPEGILPLDLDPTDRARELLAIWKLRVLAADDPARISLIAAMTRTLGPLGDATTPFIAELSEIRSDLARLIMLRERLPLTPEAYALVRASTFGAADRLAARPSPLAELVDLLLVLGSGEDARDGGDAAGPAVQLYRESAAVGFLVDTAESLLGASSDLQLYDLGAAMGVSLSAVRALRTDLYALRAAGSRMPPGSAIPALPTVTDDEFAHFREDGSDHVAEIEPWVSGEASRSGDVYRWSMLAVVSHPYAQHLVATRADHGDARSLVETFVADIYEDAVRRPGAQNLEPEVVVLGDATQPFQRVYRLPGGLAADAFYEAFAEAAQGVDDLSADFSQPHAAGLTVAGYWSHLHGLHVVEVPSDADAPERLRARVDDWFALARAATIGSEEISLTVRGLVAMRRALLDDLQPVLAASGAASVALYQPRLNIALDLLDEAAAFRASPLAVATLLTQLYEVSSMDEATDHIGTELELAINRLRDVEVPDRRTIERLASRGEGTR